MRRKLARLVPPLLIIVGLALYLPWLGEFEWQGSGVALLEQVEQVRPRPVEGRMLYVILAAAADTLMPGHTALAVHLLSLLAALIAVVATARLRLRLNPGSSIIEPAVAGLALLVSGLFWRQSVATDVLPVTMALTTIAAAIAWGGRPAAGMACFQLALFSSARAILNLPILLLAVRQRQDWKPTLTWMVPWLIYAVLVRPRIAPPGIDGPSAGYATALLPDGFVTAVALCGVIPLALVGSIGAWLGWTPGRRFLLGAGLALLLHGLVMGRAATWGMGYVPLYPWAAVLAAGTVGILRRGGEHLYGMGRWLTVVIVVTILGLNGVVSERHVVAPQWTRARSFHFLCRELTDAFRRVRVAGSWNDVRLYDYAHRGQLRTRALSSRVPLPRHEPADDVARVAVDQLLAESDVALLFEQRIAARLMGGMTARQQLLTDSLAAPGDSAAAPDEIGRFAGGLALRDVGLVPPRPAPGDMLVVRLSWRVLEAATSIPKVAVAVVDGAGDVRQEFSYWLGMGLIESRLLVPGKILQENMILRLSEELEPTEYGVEIAVYEPRRGDGTLRDMGLGHLRQQRREVLSSRVPRGVTPASLRAATLRVRAGTAQTSRPLQR